MLSEEQKRPLRVCVRLPHALIKGSACSATGENLARRVAPGEATDIGGGPHLSGNCRNRVLTGWFSVLAGGIHSKSLLTPPASVDESKIQLSNGKSGYQLVNRPGKSGVCRNKLGLEMKMHL